MNIESQYKLREDLQAATQRALRAERRLDNPEAELKEARDWAANLGHMRITGCVAWVHIPKEKRKKLDERSKKCYLIGYEGGPALDVIDRQIRERGSENVAFLDRKRSRSQAHVLYVFRDKQKA